MRVSGAVAVESWNKLGTQYHSFPFQRRLTLKVETQLAEVLADNGANGDNSLFLEIREELVQSAIGIGRRLGTLLDSQKN